MSKAFRYHKDCPEGRIFDSSELKELESQGWVDAPGKIGQQVEKEDPYDEKVRTPVKRKRGRPKKRK